MKLPEISPLAAFFLGGVAFVGVSYVCHCYFGLGPRGCQRADPRRVGNCPW